MPSDSTLAMLPEMRSVIAIALAALALHACSKSEAPAPSPSPQPTSTSDGLELVRAGTGASRVLRYDLAKGTTSTLELAMDLEVEAGGRDTRMPTLVMTVEVAVEDRLADGTMLIRNTIASATARDVPGSPIPAATMNQATSALPGTSFTAKLAPEGRIYDVQIDRTRPVPAALETQVAQLGKNFEQVAMPLPAAAVGVGAKWTARKTIEQEGMKMTAVTTTEVTALDGPRVTYTSTTTLSAPTQTLEQQGMKVEIKDIGGGGTSKGVIDLSRMTMDGDVKLEFRGTMTAQGTTAAMKMAMAMTTRPVPAPAPAEAQGAQSAP